MVGYTGVSCEVVINSSSSTPCQNGGIKYLFIKLKIQQKSNWIIISYMPIGYNCICPPNFTGINCDVQINPCSFNPCTSNGVCTQTSTGYVVNVYRDTLVSSTKL